MSELLWRGGSDHRPAVDRDEIRSASPVSRPSPLGWMRQRLAVRDARKAAGARQRIADRMDSLGKEWKVWDLKEATETNHATFLAVGPGGVFAVTVKDHGRSRISFSGDVVQVNGTRPKYVAEARKNAQLAADALSRQAGVSIPVMPVLAFAGSGTLVFYGMPKGCIVTCYQDLNRVLKARGRRLADTTVAKVYAVANHPRTWVNEPYVALADRYRWYKDDGEVDADKRTTPR
jgi:hypothetical protein